MLNKVEAMVLFIRDLDTCRAFYQDILGLQLKDSDSDSAGFSLGNQYFLLMKTSAAAHMIGDSQLALKNEGGPRGFLAASVDNIDITYETLKSKGVTCLNPPTDQSWGLRTAYFADPEGNIWEINQPIR
jgi:lactoylglutathione lyase